MAWGSTGAARDAQKSVGTLKSFKMLTGVTIYKGDIVRLTSAGYATSSTAAAAADTFVGIAYETVVNSGASGAASVRVETEGEFVFNKATAVIGDVGTFAFGSVTVDAATVDVSAGTHAVGIGKIVELVSTSKVRVKINVQTAIAS